MAAPDTNGFGNTGAIGDRVLLSWVLVALPTLAGLLSIHLYHKAVWRLVHLAPQHVGEGVLGLFLLVTALSVFRYPAGSRAPRIIIAGLAISLGLYGFALGINWGSVTATGTDEVFSPSGFALARWMLLPALVLAVFRPSLAIYPCFYVAVHKELSRAVSGAKELGVNDYLPLVESGLFLAVAVLAFSVLRSTASMTRRSAAVDWEAVAPRAIALLLAVAIGAHLGNYFLSGITKMRLDGGPFSWALENPTSSLMLAGYNLGTAPLANWPELFAWIYSAFSRVEIGLNVVTLAAQVLCFLAFFGRRLVVGFALFFDMMHIAIFVLTGALFVPWIILNSLIVAGVTRSGIHFGRVALVAGVATTILGHTIFYNARLGWYDSRQIRHGYFVAETADGNEVRVPSNFMREASYLMLTRHFGFREHRRESPHIPTSAWGQIGIRVAPQEESGLTNHKIMELSRNCAFPVGGDDATPDYDAERPGPFILGQHRRALLEERTGMLSHNLYPHHHFSWPGLFKDFYRLDLADVVAYRYIVETVCMGVKDGRVTRDVMATTRGPRIPVDGGN